MSRCKVMLVDDEITILEGFRKLFNWEAHGCEIAGDAMDGVSAIHKADSILPDLVVMDVNLPVMNGIDAIKVLRERHPEMQFVVVTGYNDFKYCRDALRLNVVDYILKPVDFDELGNVVDRVLAQKSRIAVEDFSLKKDLEGKQISKILAWLNDHLEEEISLSRLSEEFHLNSSYISQMFKNELGINYHTYLKQIRINKAKVYLSSTDMNLSEIAYLTGFKDYRLLARVFKETEGELPSRYRKRCRRHA